MTYQQERSPFTTVGKSLKKNFFALLLYLCSPWRHIKFAKSITFPKSVSNKTSLPEVDNTSMYTIHITSLKFALLLEGRGGGESSRKYWIKKEGQLLITWPGGGGAYRNFDLSNIFLFCFHYIACFRILLHKRENSKDDSQVMSITPYKILHDFFSATNVSVKVAFSSWVWCDSPRTVLLEGYS